MKNWAAFSSLTTVGVKKQKEQKYSNYEIRVWRKNWGQANNTNFDEVDTNRVCSNMNNADDYGMEGVVDLTVENGQKFSRILWYVYVASDDTIEEAENILDQYIRRYWHD